MMNAIIVKFLLYYNSRTLLWCYDTIIKIVVSPGESVSDEDVDEDEDEEE